MCSLWDLGTREKKKKKWLPHYWCLPCRGSGAYTRSNIDLVNQKAPNKTKQKTGQKKTYKKQRNSSTANVGGEGFIVKNIGCVLLPATTSLKCHSGRRYAVCYCQLHYEEDMLCVTSSLSVKKI